MVTSDEADELAPLRVPYVPPIRPWDADGKIAEALERTRRNLDALIESTRKYR